MYLDCFILFIQFYVDIVYKMGNAWMDLVKKTSAEHKGKSLGYILNIAKDIYKKPTKHNNTFNKIVNKTRNRKPAYFRKSRARGRR